MNRELSFSIKLEGFEEVKQKLNDLEAQIDRIANKSKDTHSINFQDKIIVKNLSNVDEIAKELVKKIKLTINR